MQRLSAVWESIFDLLFPPRCAYCQRSGAYLCPTCAQQAELPQSPICFRCGRLQTNPSVTCDFCLRRDDWSLTWVRAATLYTGPIQAAVHKLKYDGQKELAPFLGRYLVAAYHQQPWTNPAEESSLALDFIVPVPLHAKRFQERGFNQASLIAEAFTKSTNLPLAKSLLTRERYAESQINFGFEERQINVEDAFQIHANIAGKKILLVDDVYTTGATLNECAKTLRIGGATEVYGLTVAMPKQEETNKEESA